MMGAYPVRSVAFFFFAFAFFLLVRSVVLFLPSMFVSGSQQGSQRWFVLFLLFFLLVRSVVLFCFCLRLLFGGKLSWSFAFLLHKRSHWINYWVLLLACLALARATPGNSRLTHEAPARTARHCRRGIELRLPLYFCSR